MRTEPVGTEPKDTNFRAAEYSDRTPTSQNGTCGQTLPPRPEAVIREAPHQTPTLPRHLELTHAACAS